MPNIRTEIQTAIETAIDGMTTGGGYNYNYGQADVITMGSRTYPQTFIEWEDPTEEAEDESQEMVGYHTNDWPFNIRVIVDSTNEVDAGLDKVLHDFKLLFYNQEVTLQTKGSCYVDYISSFREYTLIAARPGIITMQFNVRYRQRQNDPDST